jgi:hypothetical protein
VEGEGDEEADEQVTPRRRSSDVPGVFGYGDEELGNGSPPNEDLEASVSTITPLRNATGSRRMFPGTGRHTPASGSRTNSVLGSSTESTRNGDLGIRTTSETPSTANGMPGEVLTPNGGAKETSLFLQYGDEAEGNTRRRSSVSARRSSVTCDERRSGISRNRRKSIVSAETGNSTDGQTVGRFVSIG